jgi:hypothetical protein
MEKRARSVVDGNLQRMHEKKQDAQVVAIVGVDEETGVGVLLEEDESSCGDVRRD